ncbi:ATP-binding cassette domain-containing protein [Piscibacillus salipiscarius]|uniref:ATP-binding cassette domain-containing protein n=2 Tax=Piscibacillus salipiscarius TaxID=299480 RepID=A0ABW5Q6J0_9BACI
MMDGKLEAKNISMHFKDYQALSDVNFTLEGNKIVGLIGRNGAGKTTLLSILAAYRDATVGYVEANGKLVFENAKYMKNSTFLYEAPVKDLQDQKASKYFEKLQLYRPNFDKTYANELMKRFKVPDNKNLSKLSKGQLSAFNMIVGLASRTPITILDEVYLGMDAPTRSMFYKELLNEQEKHPRLFILSTHLVSEMEYLFDEVMMIHEGKLLLHDDYQSIIERGYFITGSHDDVDEFCSGIDVLIEETIGGSKTVLIYEDLKEQDIQEARAAGLDISQAKLQDLFTHLTGGEH